MSHQPRAVQTPAPRAAASYPDRAPPAGWTALAGAEIGFEESRSGGSFDGTTFSRAPVVNPPLAWAGASAQVFRNGDALAVSLRGTDGGLARPLDFAAYSSVVSGSYVDAFDGLLEAVAGYAGREGIREINVVGHSLGAGAANNLRDVSAARYGGAFDGANYVTVATPVVAENQDILNVGFENDVIFKIAPRALVAPGELAGVVAEVYATGSRAAPGLVQPTYVSTTDLLVHYDDELAGGDGLGRRRLGPHDADNYIAASGRVAGSVFYGDMGRDSLVLVAATDARITYKVPVGAVEQGAFYVGRAAADDMLGGPAGDFLDGQGGGDMLDGAGGADVLHGGGGADRIGGGEGMDVARFSGPLFHYDIGAVPDPAAAGGGRGVAVAHARGPLADGTDRLDGVEFAWFGDGALTDLLAPDPAPMLASAGFKASGGELASTGADGAAVVPGVYRAAFVDGTLSFVADTPEAFLQRLYLGLLGREADGRGIAHQADRLEGGATRGEVAQGFVDSPEYIGNAGGVPSDLAFVDGLYIAFLGRQADEGDAQFWTGQLASGSISRGDVAAALADSAEAQAKYDAQTSPGVWVADLEDLDLDALYLAGLGREADPAARTAASAALDAGSLTREGLAEAIAASAEYGARHASSTAAAVGLPPELPPAMVLETRALAVRAALSGLGAAVIDRHLVEDLIAARMLAVAPPDTGVDLPHGFFFVARAEKLRDRYVRGLRDWLAAEAAAR